MAGPGHERVEVAFHVTVERVGRGSCQGDAGEDPNGQRRRNGLARSHHQRRNPAHDHQQQDTRFGELDVVAQHREG
jgi:hypothetical protein